MEPPFKRPRLFEPKEFDHASLHDESEGAYGLYDGEDTVVEVDEDDEPDEDRDVGDLVANEELQQKRAQLDNKLKSKFEAIFEKYGRDFTGIGDEIDLKTGDIVVNNGHLLHMEDETDAGTGRPSLLKDFERDQGQRLGSIEIEDGEFDEVDESHVELEDMEEDDMILFEGGSGAPLKRPQAPPAYYGAREDSRPPEDQAARNTTKASAYPSESDIIAQFGDELGPKIARYVSQQKVQDNSNIEPAWQTPVLPLATPGRRPILKSILLQPEADRSPSPKGSSSVWAPQKGPGRPPKCGINPATVFRGERIVRDRTWYTSGYVSTTVTKQRTERAELDRSGRGMSLPLKQTVDSGRSRPTLQEKQHPSSLSRSVVSDSDCEMDDSEETETELALPYRSQSNPEVGCGPERLVESGEDSTRNHYDHKGISTEASRTKQKAARPTGKSRRTLTRFTAADDEAAIKWVGEAQRMGHAIWSYTHWKMLAEQNPRHTYLSWLDRYRKWLWPQGLIDPPKRASIQPPPRKDDQDLLATLDAERDSSSELEDSSSERSSVTDTRQTSLSTKISPMKSGTTPRSSTSKIRRIGPVEIIDLTEVTDSEDDDSDSQSSRSTSFGIAPTMSRSRFSFPRDNQSSPNHLSKTSGSNPTSSQSTKRLSRKGLDSFYGFSDEEEVDDDDEILLQTQTGVNILPGGEQENLVTGRLNLPRDEPAVSHRDLDTLDSNERFPEATYDGSAKDEQCESRVDGFLRNGAKSFVPSTINDSPKAAGENSVTDQKAEACVDLSSQAHGDIDEPLLAQDIHEATPQATMGDQQIEALVAHSSQTQQDGALPISDSEALPNVMEAVTDAQSLELQAKSSPAAGQDLLAPNMPSVSPKATREASVDDNQPAIRKEHSPKAFRLVGTPISSRSSPHINRSSPTHAKSSPSKRPVFQLVEPKSQSHYPSNLSTKSPRSTLSSILGTDDVEVFLETTEALDKPLSQPMIRTPEPEEHVVALLDDSKTTPARRPIQRRSPSGSATSRSSIKRRWSASPSGSVTDTPGGSLRRCGEKGYRCQKDFCFHCLDE